MKKSKRVLSASILTLSILGGSLSFQDVSHAAQAKGWNYSSNKWHYFQNNGSLTKGWKQINNKWYFFDAKGNMQTSWVSSGGKWYYLDNSGAMKIGWVSTGGKWYFLDGSGAMKTGWISTGGKWYYLDNTGAMKTGWLSYKGEWYYLNQSGAMVKGWNQIGQKRYYFYSSGVMAKNTTIDGYSIGADGSRLENGISQITFDTFKNFNQRSSIYTCIQTSQLDKQFGTLSTTPITGSVLLIMSTGRATVDEMRSTIVGKTDGNYRVTGVYTFTTTIPYLQEYYTTEEWNAGNFFYNAVVKNGLFDKKFNGTYYDACRGVIDQNNLEAGMKVTRVVITFEKM